MNRNLFFDQSPANQNISQKVWFTGKSIDYLSSLSFPINLDEWVWHEDEVDGMQSIIITDKRDVLIAVSTNNTA